MSFLKKYLGLYKIFTYNYKDIEKYYEIFITLDRRSDELVRVVGAALYSAGRFCLQAGDVGLAADFFRKGVAVAQREKNYIARVVQALIKQKQFEESEKFLMMFSADDRESAEYLQLDFEVIRQTRQPHETPLPTLRSGRVLLCWMRARDPRCRAAPERA